VSARTQAGSGSTSPPFDNQLTQFLQDAVRFTVVVGVVEALVFVVAFVLASR